MVVTNGDVYKRKDNKKPSRIKGRSLDDSRDVSWAPAPDQIEIVEGCVFDKGKPKRRLCHHVRRIDTGEEMIMTIGDIDAYYGRVVS